MVKLAENKEQGTISSTLNTAISLANSLRSVANIDLIRQTKGRINDLLDAARNMAGGNAAIHALINSAAQSAKTAIEQATNEANRQDSLSGGGSNNKLDSVLGKDNPSFAELTYAISAIASQDRQLASQLQSNHNNYIDALFPTDPSNENQAAPVITAQNIRDHIDTARRYYNAHEAQVTQLRAHIENFQGNEAQRENLQAQLQTILPTFQVAETTVRKESLVDEVKGLLATIDQGLAKAAEEDKVKSLVISESLFATYRGPALRKTATEERVYYPTQNDINAELKFLQSLATKLNAEPNKAQEAQNEKETSSEKTADNSTDKSTSTQWQDLVGGPKQAQAATGSIKFTELHKDKLASSKQAGETYTKLLERIARETREKEQSGQAQLVPSIA